MVCFMHELRKYWLCSSVIESISPTAPDLSLVSNCTSVMLKQRQALSNGVKCMLYSLKSNDDYQMGLSLLALKQYQNEVKLSDSISVK